METSVKLMAKIVQALSKAWQFTGITVELGQKASKIRFLIHDFFPTFAAIW